MEIFDGNEIDIGTQTFCIRTTPSLVGQASTFTRSAQNKVSITPECDDSAIGVPRADLTSILRS